MKKTVILILIFLPIVLLLVIAIAGRVLSTYQRIDVERVVFIDDTGTELDDAAVFTLGAGETKPLKIRIYPELATDKRVSYTSADENICTVDSEGNVTGVGAGSAVITVKTADGNKTDMLIVFVRADRVTGVKLTPEALSIMIGQSSNLQVAVEPFAALNKKVSYTTSDPSVVTVTATGKLKAVGVGKATVTVTTEDGGFTDTCEVTVLNNSPPLLFDFTGVSGMEYTGEGYISSYNTVDLWAGLKISPDLKNVGIRLTIIQGDGATIDENGLLTFAHPSIVVVEAVPTDENNHTCRAEIRIAWFG